MVAASILAALVVTAVVTAVLLSLRVHITARGKGQWGDTWVVAAGCEFLLLTFSFAAARGCDSVLQVHLRGRRLLRRCPVFPLRKAAPKAPEQPPLSLDRLKRVRDEIDHRLGLDNALQFALSLRRHVRIKTCNGKLIYCTPDVAATGMLSGVLYLIAGLLSPLGQFEVVPEWDDLARVDGNIDLVFRFYPFRIAADTARFLWKNRKQLRKTPPRPAEAA